jgi:hypothetical protein
MNIMGLKDVLLVGGDPDGIKHGRDVCNGSRHVRQRGAPPDVPLQPVFRSLLLQTFNDR